VRYRLHAIRHLRRVEAAFVYFIRMAGQSIGRFFCDRTSEFRAAADDNNVGAQLTRFLNPSKSAKNRNDEVFRGMSTICFALKYQCCGSNGCAWTVTTAWQDGKFHVDVGCVLVAHRLCLAA